MNTDRNVLRGLRRGSIQLAITICGAVLIWGSGGGIGGFPDGAPGGNVGPYPTLVVEPTRATVPVGGNAEFKARATNVQGASYQWCRAPSGAGACVDIPGATGDTYTVIGANLADDGARYVVKLVDGQTSLAQSAYLSVSSMPGVVYQDGEFVQTDWSVTALINPPQNEATYSIARSTTWGNPGAYMRLSYDLSSKWDVRILLNALAAVYDPAAQGAIYTIDFTEDCIGAVDQHSPMLQQSGRTYAATAYWRSCSSSSWTTVAIRPSLLSPNFYRVDGPECGASESCPDFSANGAPITFGLATSPGALQTGTAVHGFDNWRVTIWRR